MTHYGRWIALCIFSFFFFFSHWPNLLSFLYNWQKYIWHQYFLLATNIFQNPWYSHRSSVSSLGCVWITSHNPPCTAMVRQTQLYPMSMWFWLWDKCCGPCQEFSCSMKFTELVQPCNNWPCCDKVEVAIVAVATWAQKIFYTILQNNCSSWKWWCGSVPKLFRVQFLPPFSSFTFYIPVSHLMYHVIHLLVKIFIFHPPSFILSLGV